MRYLPFSIILFSISLLMISFGVRRNRFSYQIFFLLTFYFLSAIIVLVSPEIIVTISQQLGFQTPVNFEIISTLLLLTGMIIYILLLVQKIDTAQKELVRESALLRLKINNFTNSER
jgi:hypothetical protein